MPFNAIAICTRNVAAGIVLLSILLCIYFALFCLFLDCLFLAK